jgi:hypothetical protein
MFPTMSMRPVPPPLHAFQSLVDETIPLGQRLAAFGAIFGLDDVVEYSLQVHRARDNKYLWLDLDKSLAEQGIGADQACRFKFE